MEEGWQRQWKLFPKQGSWPLKEGLPELLSYEGPSMIESQVVKVSL